MKTDLNVPSLQCRVGSKVSVRAGGDFHYAPEAGDDPYDLLLIGGGVGVNPLTSMYLHAASLHLQYRECKEEYKPGKVLLLYSARTYQELLYRVCLECLSLTMYCIYFLNKKKKTKQKNC